MSAPQLALAPDKAHDIRAGEKLRCLTPGEMHGKIYDVLRVVAAGDDDALPGCADGYEVGTIHAKCGPFTVAIGGGLIGWQFVRADDAAQWPEETFEEMGNVKLGDVQLFAELRKSSKYFGQFCGAQRVTHITHPRFDDAYPFHVAHNQYRASDLRFYVKARETLIALESRPTK